MRKKTITMGLFNAIYGEVGHYNLKDIDMEEIAKSEENPELMLFFDDNNNVKAVDEKSFKSNEIHINGIVLSDLVDKMIYESVNILKSAGKNKAEIIEYLFDHNLIIPEEHDILKNII